MDYTYLEAVNYVISLVGAAPVDSIDDLLPDVQDAQLRLKEASMTHQKTGWWYNTDDNVVLPRDVDNKIPVAAGTLKVVTVDGYYYTVRNGFLWDHERKTDVFEADVCANVTTWLEWEDLPYEARDFIRMLAGQEMILHSLEDYNKASTLDADIIQALMQIKMSDLEIKKRNVRYGPQFSRTRYGVRPFRSSQRNPNYPGG